MPLMCPPRGHWWALSLGQMVTIPLGVQGRVALWQDAATFPLPPPDGTRPFRRRVLQEKQSLAVGRHGARLTEQKTFWTNTAGFHPAQPTLWPAEKKSEEYWCIILFFTLQKLSGFFWSNVSFWMQVFSVDNYYLGGKKNPQAEALLWITHRLSSLPLVFSND